MSTKKHKVFRFGNNWVLLGVVVELSYRPNRYFCLPLLWRVYEKQGSKSKKDHRTKSQLAAAMIAVVAGWFPERHFLVVADSASIGKHLLRQRPANVEAVGPICWKAALYEAVTEPRRGRRHGRRLATPAALLADDPGWPAQTMTIPFKNGCERALEVKVITGVCWYTTAGSAAVQVVLIRDPKGEWRKEELVCTNVNLVPQEVIRGYCRRWSVEVALCDAKQLLGFHDPQVWCAASVQRAAPMAWFVGALIVWWYAVTGHAEAQAQRRRPWYQHKETPTFADMLATCRLQLWHHWLWAAGSSPADREAKLTWLLEDVATSP